MSEETVETQENSQADNFAALRAQKEALEAELRPLKVEKAVRDAGFDPSTPEGKALSRLAEVDATADTVKNLAAELGFEVRSTVELNPNERAAQEFAARQADLASVTSSDALPDLNQQVAEAENAAARGEGDWNTVVDLKLAQFASLAQQRGF